MTAPLDPEFVRAEPTLFEPPAATPLPPSADPTLSVERRRTLRRREDLAAGTHPTSRRPLAPEGHAGYGHTCGDCAQHLAHHHHSAVHHKCRLAPQGLTHGPGSDVRVGWPACTAWEAQ